MSSLNDEVPGWCHLFDAQPEQATMLMSYNASRRCAMTCQYSKRSKRHQRTKFAAATGRRRECGQKGEHGAHLEQLKEQSNSSVFACRCLALCSSAALLASLSACSTVQCGLRLPRRHSRLRGSQGCLANTPPERASHVSACFPPQTWPHP